MGPFKTFTEYMYNGPMWVSTSVTLLLQMGYHKNYDTSYNMGSFLTSSNHHHLSVFSLRTTVWLYETIEITPFQTISRSRRHYTEHAIQKHRLLHNTASASYVQALVCR